MNRPVAFLLLVLALLPSGVWGRIADKRAPLVQPGDRIAIFGDSISTGKGYGYLAVELMNAEQPDLQLSWLENGHPGWRSDHAAGAVDQLLAGKPTLVTIMFGTNDLGQLGARGIAELPAHLKVLVDRFKQAGVRIVLLTPPATSNETLWGASLNAGGLPQMAEEVFALGKAEGIPVFDMFMVSRLANNEGRKQDPTFQMYMAPGDVHPNALGHQLMARALANFLLGKSTPPRKPFVWHRPTRPVGDATQVTETVDLHAVEPLFPNARPMLLDNVAQILEPSRWKGVADLSAMATAGWDSANLYLEVAVTDDVVMPGERQPAWSDDGIEFFLDVRPIKQRRVAMSPGYYQLLVPTLKADGVTIVNCGKMDELDVSTVTAVYRRTLHGYLLRVAIPWSSLRYTPRRKSTIGLDFAINDRDDATQSRYKALWRGAGDDFTNAGALGTLRLR